MYGVFRFLIEFFREPDSHVGFVISIFTMGQVLCFFMIIGGIGLLAYIYKDKITKKRLRKIFLSKKGKKE